MIVAAVELSGTRHAFHGTGHLAVTRDARDPKVSSIRLYDLGHIKTTLESSGRVVRLGCHCVSVPQHCCSSAD